MENEYLTLQTIFQIVKNDANPVTYLCSPREIILRQSGDWETIREDLQKLESEDLVALKKLENIAVCITQKGIDKVRSIASSHRPSLSFSVTNRN